MAERPSSICGGDSLAPRYRSFRPTRIPPIRPCAALLGLGLAVAWWYFSRLPLRHTDLWGHLAYGRWIALHGPPVTDPLVPCASQSRFVDTAWLWQWSGYHVERLGGVLALQQLHALFVSAGILLAYHCGRRLTRSTEGGLVAGAVWLAAGWFQIQVIRPQQVGMFCAGILLTQLVTQRRILPRPLWLIPLFALWANLHGSFVIGWMHLSCALAARLVVQLFRALRRQSRTISTIQHATIGDAAVQRLARGLVVAVAATMLNPYGMELHREVFAIARHPNLADLSEWRPLLLSSRQGTVFLGIWGCLLLLLLVGWAGRAGSARRMIPLLARNAPAAGLLLGAIALGLATLSSARFIVWWAGVVAPLAGLAWRGAFCRPFQLEERNSRVGPIWLTSLMLVWGAAVRLSPIGESIASRRLPPIETLVVADTPVSIADFLRSHPPTGNLFQPMEWGDYLLWAGPPRLQVFVASHVHLIPVEQWRDYLTVVRRGTGWRGVLERHDVSMIILDRRFRSQLIRELRNDPGWREIYADKLGVILVRRDTNVD